MGQNDPTRFMKILAIGAHPDDIEICCAGTLALYSQAGHQVSIACFTSGNMGDLTVPPFELAARRKAEAERSAAMIHANLVWVGVDDEMVFPSEYQRNLMIDLLRQTDPDIVFTHSPEDYHPDHRYVSQLLFDAYFQKGLPHIPGPKNPACRFGKTQVYYMDHTAGVGFTPVEYVDITSVFETKRNMLLCHESQVRPMKELASVDILEIIDVVGRFRGYAAGCCYAEGFRRLEAHQRGLAKRILP